MKFLSFLLKQYFPAFLSYVPPQLHNPEILWVNNRLPSTVFHIPQKSGVGAGNDVTPKLTICQYTSQKNKMDMSIVSNTSQ